MGYTVYFKPLKRYTTAEIARHNDIAVKEYRAQLSYLSQKLNISNPTLNQIRDGQWGSKVADDALADRYFHEDSADTNFITDQDFQFYKTARKVYDYAIKKALMALQKATNDGYDVTCDDGFEYFGEFMLFDENNYVESYKPKTVIARKFKLSDLPISYVSKGEGRIETGRYDWNIKKQALDVSPEPIVKKTVSTKKVMDGYTFMLYGVFSKKIALMEAENMRKQGYKSRVIPFKNRHAVWVTR